MAYMILFRGLGLQANRFAVPDAPVVGQTVSLQLAAWYNDGGTITNFAAALAAGVPVGLSAVATGTVGGPNVTHFPPPPGLPNGLGNIVLALPRPQLSIIQNGMNVILTWPTNVAGFHLEFATNLASPVFWNTNSSGPVVGGG
jgi:hypothetical protein